MTRVDMGKVLVKVIGRPTQLQKVWKLDFAVSLFIVGVEISSSMMGERRKIQG